MRNFNHLSLEEIDAEIEKLQKALEEKPPVSERIARLQIENYSSYLNGLKSSFRNEVTKSTTHLRKKTAFKIVCENHLDKEFVNVLMNCFSRCSRNSNWRHLHKIYAAMNSDSERKMITFLASFYRRHILNDNTVHITLRERDDYSTILADFSQTEAF
jgi:hypothetical protein